MPQATPQTPGLLRAIGRFDLTAAALSGYQQQEQLDKQRLQQSKEDRSRIQQLEAELTRKNAALAETAALLVLSKKSRAIWGDSGEC